MDILHKLAAPARSAFKETSKHSIIHLARGTYFCLRPSWMWLLFCFAAHLFCVGTTFISLLLTQEANMAPFSQATTALLAALAPSVSAFAPPKASNSANVAASSPPRAVSIPVEPATAPWDRITGSSKEGTATATGDRDEWVRNLNYDAFAKDVTVLGNELQQSSGPDDVEHLSKVS